MKKDTRIYILSVATAFAVLLTLFLRQSGKNRIESTPNGDTLTTPSASFEKYYTPMPVNMDIIQQVSPTANVSWSCRYIECGHTYISHNAENILGLTRDEISDAYPNWELVEFSKRKVVLRTTHSGYCPQHFILKYAAGGLCVYTVDEITNMEKLLMRLPTSLEIFPSQIQSELKAGIAFDSLQAIDRFIEAHDS